MKFPSKVTPYQANILAKFPVALSCLETEDMRSDALYKKVKSKVLDIGEFLEILDCLYALGKVELYEVGYILHTTLVEIMCDEFKDHG